MVRLGDTYRGPQMPLWRRLVLQYSGSIAWTLALAWLGLMAGWRLPTGLIAGIFVGFALMLLHTAPAPDLGPVAAVRGT